jgi:hypothetical protein
MNTPVHSIEFPQANKAGRWPRIFFAVLLAANLSAAFGQSLAPVAGAVPALRPNETAAAAITFSNGSSLKVRSGKSGQFPLVAANPGETVGIQMRFPSALARARTIAQALDGGVIPASQQDSSLAFDGTTSIQFQLPAQPGLYRVVIRAGAAASTLQFWVVDLQNPSANPPALKP